MSSSAEQEEVRSCGFGRCYEFGLHPGNGTSFRDLLFQPRVPFAHIPKRALKISRIKSFIPRIMSLLTVFVQVPALDYAILSKNY
jgi:hypothetical protein